MQARHKLQRKAKAEVKANLKALSQKLSLWAQCGVVGGAAAAATVASAATNSDDICLVSVAKGKAKRTVRSTNLAKKQNLNKSKIQKDIANSNCKWISSDVGVSE